MKTKIVIELESEDIPAVNAAQTVLTDNVRVLIKAFQKVVVRLKARIICDGKDVTEYTH